MQVKFQLEAYFGSLVADRSHQTFLSVPLLMGAMQSIESFFGLLTIGDTG